MAVLPVRPGARAAGPSSRNGHVDDAGPSPDRPARWARSQDDAGASDGTGEEVPVITSLALLGIALVLWFLIALPLAVLVGRSIRVGQTSDASRTVAARGRDRPRRRTAAA